MGTVVTVSFGEVCAFFLRKVFIMTNAKLNVFIKLIVVLATCLEEENVLL